MKTALDIEDNEDNMELITFILEENGFRTLRAETGRKGVDLALRACPDFILLDIQKIHGFVRSLIPEAHRSDYDIIVAGIDRGLAGVIRGQLTICVVNGVLTYVGLLVFGVKYSIILAVVASVLSLIPIFGSILSTIP